MKKILIALLFHSSFACAQGFKAYVATLEQNFTNPPFTVDVMKNTLGGTPTFTRNFAGNYGVHLTGAFPINRTIAFIQSTIYGWAACYRISDDEITIETREVSFGINSIDNFLNATSFEIRVYDTSPTPEIKDTTVNLSSAQILNIFSSPVTVIPSPGVGKTIELVQATGKLMFNTTAYIANSTLLLKTATATAAQTAFTGILNAGANAKANNTLVNPDLSIDTQIIANQPLIATTQTTNPINGNSTVELHIYYRIVDY
jgi:hypothetical protein